VGHDAAGRLTVALWRRPPKLFRRVDGGIRVQLGEEASTLVVSLFDQLRDLITASPDDPAVRRLFPPAYHLADDAQAEAEFQRLMHPELAAQRLAALGTASQLLTADRPLDDGEMMALVQSVNAVRLVLGTMLDVDEAHDPRTIPDDDPALGQHHLYAWLGYVLDSALSAMSSE
jgi:Domain of unknown function (DUF2017)